MRSVIGGDPGSKGAVVLINEPRYLIRCVRLIGSTRSQYKKIMRDGGVLSPSVVAAYIEINHSISGDFLPQIFTQGRNYERMLAVMEDEKYKIVDVDCQKWQRFHRLAGKMEPGDRMRAYVVKAKRLFPGLHITQDNAAAYLIADYAWWQEFGY